jgi:hypothetical protein
VSRGLDRERIFFRHWFYVGRSDGLSAPGHFLVADVAGESIIVIRGKGRTGGAETARGDANAFSAANLATCFIPAGARRS